MDRTPLFETTRFGAGTTIFSNLTRQRFVAEELAGFFQGGWESQVQFLADFLITCYDLWMMIDNGSPSFDQEVWGICRLKLTRLKLFEDIIILGCSWMFWHRWFGKWKKNLGVALFGCRFGDQLQFGGCMS